MGGDDQLHQGTLMEATFDVADHLVVDVVSALDLGFHEHRPAPLAKVGHPPGQRFFVFRADVGEHAGLDPIIEIGACSKPGGYRIHTGPSGSGTLPADHFG